ncbi:MAG: dTDP-4-dehydrorhamnose reductase [Planctomycetota bacterium]|nr:MAG: dTDP-4-dehydrorhamnose reductase [Planctomycetota bacterium]
MKLFITGSLGQVGRALMQDAAQRGYDCVGFDLPELDVTDAGALAEALGRERPDWVFHCAAATKVDSCESEVEWARTLNGEAPGYVANACKSVGAGLVHFSTDFIFDGAKGSHYVEDDLPRPLSVYGSSKLLGEERVATAGLERWYILRTQWVYGPIGRNFPAAILARAESGQPLKVVDDQIGQPTYAPHLAAMGLDLIATEAPSGIYHSANVGEMSWHDFACSVLQSSGYGEIEVARCSSEELAQAAARPKYSVLDTSKLSAALGQELPSVQDGLRDFFAAKAAADTGE